MADNKYATSAEAKNAILAKIANVQRALRNAQAQGTVGKDIQSIQDSSYGKELSKLEGQLRSTGMLGEIGAGMTSTAVGMLTGIPDLAAAGVNLAARTIGKGDVFTGPSLQQRAMEAAGMASEPTSQQGAIPFYAPEVATGVYGVASLLKGGIKGMRDFFTSRKIQRFTESLPTDEANVFKNFMMKGQGGDDARVASILQRLSTNPEYSEMFNKLQAGATKAALEGMAVRPSRLTPETATEKLLTGMEAKIASLSDARAVAGDKAFTKAAELGGDRSIVSVDNTLKNIRSLKDRFSKGATESSQKAVSFLQSLEDGLVPSITVPSRAGATVTTPATAANTLMNIPGEAATSLRVPGGAGYTTKLPQRQLSVQEAQALLSEFGKKASMGESLIKDLAISDERIISSAIFGGLKDDLVNSLSLAKDVNDKKAIGALISAREQTKNASDAYNKVIAQGLPAFMQNKAIAEISPEKLTSVYSSLTPSQQNAFRSYVGTSNKEALQAIDKSVYDSFIKSATKELPDGTIGVDLGTLAQKWKEITTGGKTSEGNAIAASLGQNFNEFSSRMKDALVFSRKQQVGAFNEPKTLLDVAGKDIAAAAGTGIGYMARQATQLGVDALKALQSTGLSEQQLMKVLMTPEGSSFLKNASLSPYSAKTLEEFGKIQSSVLNPLFTETATFKNPLFRATMVGAVAPQGAPEAAPEALDMGMPDISPEILGAVQGGFQELPDISAGVFEGMPAVAPAAFSQAGANVDRRAILNSELAKVQQSLQATQNPDEQARAQADIDSLTREIGRLPK